MKKNPHFILEEKIKSQDIDSEIFVYKHKILETKFIFVKNKDKEKAFNVSFKTPSKNSKGFQHILEHSVLRSSKKYDFKNRETFAELIKKSSTTFLNAMTYDDKTVYPFSTMIDSEFFKIMDVYVDAVLNPLCVKNKNYFKQEGWRWEKDESGKYFINGVVFNEMKGRLSSKQVYAISKINENIFPDTEYRFNAGGDPNEIIDLKYEDFVKYHQKYYHPTNATFLFYGDLNIEKVLEKIQKDFLQNFKKGKKAEKTKIQKKIKSPKRKKYFFSSNNTQKNSMLTISFLANNTKDIKQNFINNFLYNCILDKNSIVYKNILDSNLVEDFSCFLETENIQNVFHFIFEGIDPKNGKKIEKIFFDSLKKLFEEKINPKIINSNLNNLEFSILSRNFFPQKWFGILESIMTQNLHAENFSKNFEYKKNIEFLKKEIEKNILEKNIENLFLKNSHFCVLNFEPKKDFKIFQKVDEKTKKINAIKDKKILEKIDQEILEFKKYQEEELDQKVLEKIKPLSSKFLPKKIENFDVKIEKKNGTENYFKKINEKNLLNYSFLFDGNFLEKSEIQYLEFISNILDELAPRGEKEENFLENFSEKINIFSSQTEVLEDHKKNLKLKLHINTAFLSENKDFALQNISALLHNINFSEKKIKQNIKKEILDLKNKIPAMGNSLAALRAKSKISQKDFLKEQINGFEYLIFLQKMEKEADKNFKNLEKKLENISKKIFIKNNLIILQNAFSKDLDLAEKMNLKKIEKKANKFVFKLKKENEAIIFPEIENSFNALSCSLENQKNISKISCISNFLNMSYMWEKIREEGGAYGASFQILEKSKILIMSSYMDSRVLETYKDYEKISDFLKNKNFSKKDVENIVAQALSGYFNPKDIFSKTYQSFLKNILKIDNKKENKIFQDKKNLSKKDIEIFTKNLDKILKNGAKVSVLSPEKISKNKKIFDKIIYIK